MSRILLLLTIVSALASSGCCRMCCWQRGGSWYNGYCYPQVPPAAAPVQQPVYAAPTYAQPCTCQ